MKTVWQTIGVLGMATSPPLICLLVAWVLLSVAVGAETRPAPALHIATWDVTQAENNVFSRRNKENKTTWRHTFGSERQDARMTRIGIFNLDVDIVLLQGVRNVRALRRIFPTRDWRLILSRDYLRSTPALSRLPSDLRPYDISASERILEQPITAVAVRYQRNLRVRGIRHIKISNKTDENSNVLTPPPSATAVRVNHRGSTLWLVSVAMTSDCKMEQSTCNGPLETKKWQNLLSDTDPALIIAGRSQPRNTPVELDHSENKLCGSFRKMSQTGTSGSQLGDITSLSRRKLGCIVRMAVTLH